MVAKLEILQCFRHARFDFFSVIFRTDRYLVAFKSVGTIRQLKIRLQENPNGGYFGGWTFSKVKNAIRLCCWACTPCA